MFRGLLRTSSMLARAAPVAQTFPVTNRCGLLAMTHMGRGMNTAATKEKPSWKWRSAMGVLNEIKLEEFAKAKAAKPFDIKDIKPGQVLEVIYTQKNAKGNHLSVMGRCIALDKNGALTSLTLRNVFEKETAEISVRVFSPLVHDINILAEAKGKLRTRRSKLYYLRERPLAESTFTPKKYKPKSNKK